MTDDIAARLRAWAPLVSTGHEVPAAGQVMFTAADEIERLRAALRDIALFSPYKHSSTLRRKARAALEGEKTDV